MAPRRMCEGRGLAKPFGMNRIARILSRGKKLVPQGAFGLAIVMCAALGVYGSVGCSRNTSVYADPSPLAAVTPVSTDARAFLPKDFYNQSVGHASVELQPDGITAASKAIQFQTAIDANASGGFNGSGVGNRAVLGNGAWHGRPVAQAEPVTFDAKNYSGSEAVGVNLQIDLACDGVSIRVVNAAGGDIGLQNHAAAGDGYTRFTASTSVKIWLSPTSAILDPDNSAVLVPATGTPVTLQALLAKFPAACLKNASTGAKDLANGVPTAGLSLALGTDSTLTINRTFVRRITIGSEVYAGLE